MDADEIWASPATLTGSIGVFAVFPTFERTLEKFGVTHRRRGHDAARGARCAWIARSDRWHAKSCSRRSITPTACSSATSRRRAKRTRTRSTRLRRAASGRASMRASTGWSISLATSIRRCNAAAKRAGLGKDYEVKYIEPPLGWRAGAGARAACDAVTHRDCIGIRRSAARNAAPGTQSAGARSRPLRASTIRSRCITTARARCTQGR